AELESDLGGADQLTAAAREVVQRTALSAVMLRNMEAEWLEGRGVDVAAYTTLANTQSRLLKLIGLERRTRDVTPALSDYLASRPTETTQDSISAAPATPPDFETQNAPVSP